MQTRGRTKPLSRLYLLLYQTQVLDCQFHTRIVWSSEALRIQGYSWKTIQTRVSTLNKCVFFGLCSHPSLWKKPPIARHLSCTSKGTPVSVSPPPFYQLFPQRHFHLEISEWKPDKGIKDYERQRIYIVLTFMYLCVRTCISTYTQLVLSIKILWKDLLSFTLGLEHCLTVWLLSHHPVSKHSHLRNQSTKEHGKTIEFSYSL